MDKDLTDFAVTHLAPLTDLARKAVGTEIETIKRDRNGDVPIMVVDEGREVHDVTKFIREFERTQPQPYRRRGTVVASDIPTLLAWMAAQTEETSPVFGVGLDALNGEWR